MWLCALLFPQIVPILICFSSRKPSTRILMNLVCYFREERGSSSSKTLKWSSTPVTKIFDWAVSIWSVLSSIASAQKLHWCNFSFKVSPLFQAGYSTLLVTVFREGWFFVFDVSGQTFSAAVGMHFFHQISITKKFRIFWNSLSNSLTNASDTITFCNIFSEQGLWRTCGFQ